MAAPDAPILVVDDDPTRTARRPGRVMLAVAALVPGIGSCQLPQPHLPKFSVGAVGGVSVVAGVRVSAHASDRT